MAHELVAVSQSTSLDHPVGSALKNWQSPRTPAALPMQGLYADVRPLDIALHSEGLFEAFATDTAGEGWVYMAYGPFASKAQFDAWLGASCLGSDPMFYVIIDPASGAALGMASFMNINPRYGSIEVGNIHFSPLLRRTRIATDAMFQMMKHAFELGYRRYEWKCNALNAPSRAAAIRLGFSYEGVFRQHMVVKSRNRDTAWYACVDHEWPALRRVYEKWLSPSNFNADGSQRTTLSALTAPLLVATG